MTRPYLTFYDASYTGGVFKVHTYALDSQFLPELLMSTPLNISLAQQGFDTEATLFCNLGTAPLVEAALANSEGMLAKDGPLVVKTGAHTGRSAKDKYIVRDAETENSIWWGKTNVAMDPAHFAALKEDFIAALGGKDKLYVADLFGGSQPEHRVNVRVINELAWHNLFIRTLLVRPSQDELTSFVPEYTIIDLPSFRADPARRCIVQPILVRMVIQLCFLACQALVKQHCPPMPAAH